MTTDARASHLLRLSERVYRALLVLYPADFRQDYSQHMVQMFRDVCRDAYRDGGAAGLALWWAAALFDLVQTVIEQRRKVSFTMTRAKYIQWSGWLFIFGGAFFIAGGLSQLQLASGTDPLSVVTLIPGMILITMGLLGIVLRYYAHIVLFGKLALLTTLVGAGIAAVSWCFMFFGQEQFWFLFMGGWLIHLGGHSVFGGFAATTHLLPKWNFALLIGSAFPLTVGLLLLQNQASYGGINWAAVVMLLLIGVGWVLTGWALNSQPDESLQPATSV